MKRERTTILSLAAAATVSVAMLGAASVRAQDAPAPPADSSTMPAETPMQAQPAMQADPAAAAAQAGAVETMQMVSARVSMKGTLDAGKAKPGDEFRTTLARKVQLKNGTELPAGTILVGVVGTDDMQIGGRSKLVLNFTKAELKDGLIVPIKATIVGIYAAESQDMSGRPTAPGDEETSTWTGHPDAVDEIGALPGVDLHSRVISMNSGVLTTTSKHDIKLKYGTEIALAVAAQPPAGV